MVQETSFILLVYVITFDLLLLWVWKWIEISTLSQLHFKLSLKVWMCCNQKTKKRKFLVTFMSSSCPLTSFFWLLSHMIYLELIKVLLECLLSQSCFWMTKLKVIPKKLGNLAKLMFRLILSFKNSQFLWWEVNLRGLRAFILRQKKFCYPLGLLPITQLWERRHYFNTFVILR